MRLWLERLFRLNKKLDFTVKHIAVSGTPWNTTAVIGWRDTATLADGDTSYFNDGAHVIRMRWGKVVSLHACLDAEKVVSPPSGAWQPAASPKPRPHRLKTEAPGPSGETGPARKLARKSALGA
jgi:hypothetical protein